MNFSSGDAFFPLEMPAEKFAIDDDRIDYAVRYSNQSQVTFRHQLSVSPLAGHDHSPREQTRYGGPKHSKWIIKRMNKLNLAPANKLGQLSSRLYRI